MEGKDHGLVKKLIEENEGFRAMYKTHKDYDTKVARFKKRSFLLPEDFAEMNRLKKLKLDLKDRMEREISKYRGRA